MKATAWIVLFLATVFTAPAQINFSTNGSSWGAGNFFFGDGSGVNPFRTTELPGSSTAYAGGTSTGTQYVFGFAYEPPTSVSSYNLATTDLSVGTSLTLVLTGFTALPRYIAYTGGSLTDYTYDSAAGQLTLSATTINAAPSSSVASNPTLASAFGLIVETGGAYDFGGSIFRTDGFWGDIATLNSNYPGQLPLAGVNFNGTAGSSVTFDAYLTTQYLTTIGINTPAECAAYLQKEGSALSLDITRQLFTTNGSDPDLPGGGYTWGESILDIDGSGLDNYVVATYANSSWSEGNIGVVPEPTTYALLTFSAAIVAISVVRRRTQ